VRKPAIILFILGLALSAFLGCAKKADEIAMGDEAPAPAMEESETMKTPEGGEKYKMAEKTDDADYLAKDTSTGTTPDGTGGSPGEAGDLSGIPTANAEELTAEMKLIKTASLTCEVEDVDAGFEKVHEVAKAEKGLVVGTTRSSVDEGYDVGSVTIKVHPSKYEETMKALRKVGRLLEENSSTSDVTQEYYDLQARLDNAEATRARYLEILATRTGTVPDILEVEREIERVTETIEVLKGQLRYLDSQVGLSTITVYLEEPHTTVPTGYSFGKAVKDAFRIAVRICIFLVQAVIVLLPFVIILIIIVLIIRFVFWIFQRRRRRAKAAAADA
jgi:hypothetical protein